jgi:hypothetical protein
MAARARDTSDVTATLGAREPAYVDVKAGLSAGVEGATVPSRLLGRGGALLPTSVGTSKIISRMTSNVPPINAKQGVQRHARISLNGFAACIDGPTSRSP